MRRARTRLGMALAAVAAFILATVPSAAQEPGDSVTLAATDLLIGQRATLNVSVRAPAGAIVEIDPVAESWNGVEVVRITRLGEVPAGAEALHRFEVVVAPFLPGPGSFAPTVAIITADGASLRTLPQVSWTVRTTLPEGAPLELSPLPGPRAISGAESPLLKPALALAGLAALAILGLGAYGGARLVARRLRGRTRPPEPEAPPIPAFDAIESILDSDPVSAYRALAAAVRGFISNRYGLPATALTTSELRARMETSGADRFAARLVGGLLEECDSVVYAGYRPAAERRRADLTMAREIVEGAG